MFLKKVSSQLSYRLALTYLCFFIPCYLLTFGGFYVWTADFLKTRDHDLIEARITQCEEIVEKEGAEGLRKIYSDTKTRTGASRFLLELTDLQGNVLFFHMTEDLVQEFSNVEEQMKMSQNVKNESWFYIASKDHDEDAIEVKTVHILNKYKLSVGSSTDMRDELLEKFQAMFLTILIPLLLSSIFLSIFIAQKFLKPISNLANLIKEVKNGNLSSRANLPKYKDELYELTVTFNDMLSQIEYLIDAMKDTLDNVAHDLRTPLARARLASELALKSGSPEKLKLAAEEGIENLDIILNMIQTIMTMSGLNSKTLLLRKEKFIARKVIEEVVDLYLFVAEEKNISLSIVCKNDIEAYGDMPMIRQVLANLVDNAIKYSPSDSHIILKGDYEKEQTIFSVIDEGQGIPEDDIPRIWERLYRGDKSRHEKGFGLGLSLVKIFVESNGGSVSVQSELGKGSKFKVMLPTV